MRAHSTLEPIPHPESQAGLARWRELTRQANSAFDRHQFAHAQHLYRQALQVAAALARGPALAVAARAPPGRRAPRSKPIPRIWRIPRTTSTAKMSAVKMSTTSPSFSRFQQI